MPYCGGSIRGHRRTLVRYYIFSKIRSYVKRLTKMFWITILLDSKVLGFEILSNVFVFRTFLKCFEFEALLYNKILQFWNYDKLLYWIYLNSKMFWCPNCRYNGSHVSICANKLWEHFNFLNSLFLKLTL